MEGGITGKGFKPGQSGNANGRPVGARSFKTVVREMLEVLPENPTKDAFHPIAQELVKIAFGKKSNQDQRIKALNMLLDRMEGRPKEYVEISDNILTVEDAKETLIKRLATLENGNGENSGDK